MEKIKEEIENFKKQNGNAGYSEKDFLMYIASKIDKIDDRLEKGSNKIAENRVGIQANATRINGFANMMKILVPIIATFLGWLALTALGVL